MRHCIHLSLLHLKKDEMFLYVSYYSDNLITNVEIIANCDLRFRVQHSGKNILIALVIRDYQFYISKEWLIYIQFF